MTRISVAFGRLLDGLAIAAALLLLAMVIVVSVDIIIRNLTQLGIPWANEASEYALYFITLLTAPWLLRRGQHVRIDIVLTIMPPRVAWLLEAISDVLGCALCMILIRYGAAMTYDSWRLSSLTIKYWAFPEWWLLAPLPICFALLALEFVLRFHRLMGAPHTRRTEATSVG
jgi:TRAP-type C4-dicarboxylate transport system permease small subunit